ncbi:MAG: mannose-6-phosphate isomerase, class I [Chloroflexota bacterium]
MLSVQPRPYLLQNPVQHYAWGTRDEEAFIAKLLGVKAQPGLPYAELWMGTHPNAPSQVLSGDQPVPLPAWIAAHPQAALGERIARRFAGKLPFLFKVLSAGEALSIQAHPDKSQAGRLHANDPEHYPDDNHKPEIAIALDTLSALTGVKPFSRMVETLEHYPEIAAFLGPDIFGLIPWAQSSTARQRDFSSQAFRTLIQRSISAQAELQATLARLARRFDRSAPTDLEPEERLFLSLREQYPDPDVGLLAIFLLNRVTLQAGQGLYTPAGVPHAYLKGNIVECMANSDNVVRVGLTPKFKDAPALLEILAVPDELSAVHLLPGQPQAEQVIYTTPAQEFRLTCYHLKPDVERTERSDDGLAILLVTTGKLQVQWQEDGLAHSETFQPGQAVFIPALLETFRLHAIQESVIFKVNVP